MPIYLDRPKDSELAAAKNVAELQQEDLEIQDQPDCRGLTYWYDEQIKTAFCLIEASTVSAIQNMLKSANGESPNQIKDVDFKIIKSFLRRFGNTEKAKNILLNLINDPAFRIIMVIQTPALFTRNIYSSEHISPLSQFDHLFSKFIQKHDGTKVKQTDHSFLISFKTITKAVKTAFEIQACFYKNVNKFNGNGDALKIALNSGAPVTAQGKLIEDNILLADRMCRIVNGQIILSSEVNELYNNENSISLQPDANICILTKHQEAFLTRLMDYLNCSWSNASLHVNDLCKPLGCSKSQLYRKMVSLTGNSPLTFINRYRLNEALILLQKNTMKISEIAYETGFTSPSYFSKCFQKRFGYSPSVFYFTETNSSH